MTMTVNLVRISVLHVCPVRGGAHVFRNHFFSTKFLVSFTCAQVFVRLCPSPCVTLVSCAHAPAQLCPYSKIGIQLFLILFTSLVLNKLLITIGWAYLWPCLPWWPRPGGLARRRMFWHSNFWKKKNTAPSLPLKCACLYVLQSHLASLRLSISLGVSLSAGLFWGWISQSEPRSLHVFLLISFLFQVIALELLMRHWTFNETFSGHLLCFVVINLSTLTLYSACHSMRARAYVLVCLYSVPCPVSVCVPRQEHRQANGSVKTKKAESNRKGRSSVVAKPIKHMFRSEHWKG